MQLLIQYCAREGVTKVETFRRAKAKELKRPLSFDERLAVDQEAINFGRADVAPEYLRTFLQDWRRTIYVPQV